MNIYHLYYNTEFTPKVKLKLEKLFANLYKTANSKIMLLKNSRDQFALCYCIDYLKRHKDNKRQIF